MAGRGVNAVTVPDGAAAFRDEYERLTRAGEYLAQASADLSRAAGLLSGHASVVVLGDLLQTLQLTRSTLAASAERAFSLGEIAARRARYASMRAWIDDS